MRKATVLLATMMVLACLTAGAASDQQLAAVKLGPNQLIVEPMVASNGMAMTISGPAGYLAQQSARAGEPLTFSLDGLADGSYRYELRFTPVLAPEVLETMTAARKADDLETLQALRDSGKIPIEAMTQTGSFAMHKGSLVASDTNEVAAKHVLHYDDVVITGSLCVGFDCVDGETFGYDTIKLKENNLRLFFEDTSTGSFPAVDWRIRVNDTTSGGGNYFAIEDATNSKTPFRIESNAPNHSLYVEDYGRVGLGTSIPTVELHVVDGDSPTMRLDQDTSSGWTAQVWDLCGNETNFFLRDVTNGSKLCFRVQPNTPSNTLTLKSDGNVGIGTWSPSNRLDIYNSVDDNFGFQLSRSADQWVVQLNKSTDATAPNGLSFTKVGTGVREMQLQTDGDLYITGRYYSNGTLLNVPDYVFEEGYNLLPLSELQTFIRSEKHLPNVPSAEQIKAEGLNLSELQMQLLQKVEELTLYLVEQAETNTRQQEMISSQQQIIEELRARLSALEQ